MARPAPYVPVNEIDLTGTATADNTTVGAIVLRNTFKGSEYELIKCANDNDLVTEYGYPMDTFAGSASSSSYIDFMTASGFLADSPQLYTITVKPSGAKYASTKITSGYATTARTSSMSAEKTSYSVDTGTFKSKELPSKLAAATFAGGDMFWMTASSRGAWANATRFLVVDRQLYDCVRYWDTTQSKPVYPTGYTTTSLTSAASALASTMYSNYTSWSSGGGSEATGTPWVAIKGLNTPMTNDKEFIVIVQAAQQGSTSYSTVETWNVSIDTGAQDDIGRSKFCETVINSRSGYIRMVLNPTLKVTQDLDPATIASKNFNAALHQWTTWVDSGSNGTWTQADEDAAVAAAIDLMASTESYKIDLLLDGNKSNTIKQKLVDTATNVRKDCMAILDCALSDVMDISASKIAANLLTWKKTLNINSSYAAIYANWLYVFDKWNQVFRWVPASGYVAGAYARTDKNAYPWFAPSGYTRGILRNVSNIAWNPSKTFRDQIFGEGMNPILTIANVGTAVILGQTTTLNAVSAFQDVNVRRLFLYLERAISNRAKYYMEEPNDEVTRLRFTNDVLPLLRTVKANRGLDKFQMICDETNNTAVQLENDQLRADFYLTPTKTASVIQLNFVGTQSGADYSEITLTTAYTGNSYSA